jgi:hypothetical protein
MPGGRPISGCSSKISTRLPTFKGWQLVKMIINKGSIIANLSCNQLVRAYLGDWVHIRSFKKFHQKVVKFSSWQLLKIGALIFRPFNQIPPVPIQILKHTNGTIRFNGRFADDFYIVVQEVLIIALEMVGM